VWPTDKKVEGDHMKIFCTVVSILLIVGGLNWGLVGLFNLNLVDLIFGVGSLLSKVVYILVGLSAVVAGWKLFSGSCKDTSCKM
jgi:uncharacterized membrane protein YuzA (DUF378 family)